jgi:hypothetical protein
MTIVMIRTASPAYGCKNVFSDSCRYHLNKVIHKTTLISNNFLCLIISLLNERFKHEESPRNSYSIFKVYIDCYIKAKKVDYYSILAYSSIP